MLSSCGAPIATGYRTYSLTDQGIAHLSFEYPADFNVRLVQLYDDTGYERIDIDGPFSRKLRSRATIWVVVQRKAAGTTLADRVQNAIDIASPLPGYRLIEKSSASVNGIAAEQFIYFYINPRSDYESRIIGLEPLPLITREVFFISGGLYWTLAMSTHESSVEADTPGFEHLIQTLAILP